MDTDTELSFEGSKVAMMNEKYFNFFGCSPPFDKCTNRLVDELAAQISRALKDLGNGSQSHSEPRMLDETSSQFDATSSLVSELPVAAGEVSAVATEELEKSQEKDGEISSTPSTSHTQKEQTPLSSNSKSGKRKQPVSFTPDVQIDVTKKTKQEDHLQKSCEDHLVSATSHFIPISKLELPPKVRQFRRVNDEFVKSLEVEMEKNPAGSYGSLFVVARGISNRSEWKVEQKDQYTYEVLGGTHLSVATKKMNQKDPNNEHFQGRMCRIYVGINDEQAVFLGSMHQQTSMFQHEVTYIEEDVVTKVGRIVDLVRKINFVRLVTSFNVVIICPTAEAHHVLSTLLSQGAVEAQQGFIINKGIERRTHDLLMAQVVDSFVVGHWSVTRDLTQRHVAKSTTNLIQLVDTATERNPEELYEFLIEAFSLQEDHILDLDSENGNGMLAAFTMGRNAIYLDEITSAEEQWQLTENIRERAQSSD